MGWYTTAIISFACDLISKTSLKNYDLNEKGYYETGFDNKRHIHEEDIFQFIESQMIDIHRKIYVY